MQVPMPELAAHMRSNEVKSVLLLAGLPLLLLLIMFAFFAVSGYGYPQDIPYDLVEAGVNGVLTYGHYAIIGAGIWFAIAWFSHQAMINASTGARSLTREEAPVVYRLVESICRKNNLPMPKIQVIDSPVLNAFASGIKESNYTVTLTRGIIDALEEDELKAVIGHELSHIRHRDVRLLIISVIFAGIISFACQMIFRNMMFAGRDRSSRDGRMMIIAFAVMAVGYVLAMAIRFALSRRREYLADAGSVELTGDPGAMIRALQKISGHAEMPRVPDDVKQMCIENAHGFMGMFATHPPIKKRIEALVALGGEVGQQPQTAPQQTYRASSQSPQSEQLFMPNKNPWRRRHGPWG